MNQAESWKILKEKKVRVVPYRISNMTCEIIIEGWDYERKVKTGVVKRTGITCRYNTKPCDVSKAMKEVKEKIVNYFIEKKKKSDT